MYRMMQTEQNVSGAAVALSAFSDKTNSAATSSLLMSVVAAVGTWFQRAAVTRELHQLDDHMLTDIGVARVDIEDVAERAVPGKGAEIVEAFLANPLVAPVRNWFLRHRMMSELSSMDDRMLADIGLNRADVPEVVARARHPQAAGSILTGTVEQEVSAIRAWKRARTTARELSRLDDRMLIDIGIVRGDIEWLASEVARKAVYAANRNHAGQPGAGRAA